MPAPMDFEREACGRIHDFSDFMEFTVPQKGYAKRGSKKRLLLSDLNKWFKSDLNMFLW